MWILECGVGCLGRPLRVRGSLYDVIVSSPADRRMLHVCVDMILSPDRASFFKLLLLHRQVPSFFVLGFFASHAEVLVVLGADLPLG